MRLKKLEITGFKSFREKVVVDFAPGISGIVGPNGCGKSNIADAIRWVMGEQRVKTLRGKKMDDVIFNGSEEAAPVGMAEVSMMLTADGQQFPGNYAECNEMMITRRLFRDGESEYTINKIPCRLLDVREFFMGTGVGARTYSLVEQNSVASLVEAKPEDRRQFIEEAAGISKYKSRRESAVRKMEATRENMVRLNDILREVKTQLNAISRQAKKAEQYKALKQALKEAELTVALQTCSDLSARRTSREEAKNALKKRETEVRTRMQGLEAALEELKAEVLENEGLISTHQEKLYGTKNAINIKEQGIDFSRRKIADLAARREKDLAEGEALKRREGETDGEIAALRAAAAEAEERIGTLREEVAEGAQALEELRRMDRTCRLALEEKKVRYIDIVTEKAKLKNMVAGLARMVEDFEKREAHEVREIEENGRRSAELGRTLEKLRSGLTADEEGFAELGVRREEIADELERARGELAEAEERIAGLREENSRKASRLASLREFEESYAGCNEGIKSLMTGSRGASGRGLSRELFLGLVADHIHVPREYETAVEAVLGEKLQYVVVKDQTDGVRAIDYLKSASLGRGSFVPLEVRPHASGASLAEHEHLREAVPLIERITVQEDCRAIVNELLGDVLLIPNLGSGISLWRQNGFCGTFVTPEGDIISPSGILTGGSGTGADRSLLRNRREIAELTEEVAKLQAELQEEQDGRKKAASLIAQWDEELLRIRSRLHLTELRISGLRKDVERYEGELHQVGERLKALNFNRESLAAEAADARGKIVRHEAEMKAIEAGEAALNGAMAVDRERGDALRTDLEERERVLTEQKVRLASIEEKWEADLRTLARLETSLGDHAREIAARTADAAACEREAQAQATLIAAEEAALKGLYAEYETIEKTISGKRDAQQEKEALLRAQEAEIREVKKILDAQLREGAELEVAAREIVLQMENLQRNIQEKYGADLLQLLPEFQPLEEEALAELAARLGRDRQAVENFGEVNLLALSEHEELKTRFEFLTGQIADLNASLETLQKTISRINTVSRQRFAETFAGVNKCFQEVFTRLFPGGRADLSLTDENDLLETGVDIEIRIPGKRAQSVTLLSGGEKSLSAIALIFSILLYRPVPFVLLDEVDAALDDSNISLFNRLVKDTATQSQILMITHNKKSMEIADSLYGVTIQKQGVSTLVSVNLN
ncbi:MAG: chromosome segregation protein SMC [Deltaproteobacteria bacterium]|nr:chromosome segregation protein SMC [Deltaproteobacteria bacterium]